MNYIKHAITLVIAFFLISCSDDKSEVDGALLEGTEITSFSFLQSNNSSLSSDIVFEINNNVISGRLPYSSDIEGLVSSFDHSGLEVEINNINQVSGLSVNDFSKGATYTVKTSDGRQEEYEVRSKYYTGLPIIYLNTNGTSIDSKEDYVNGTVSVYGGLAFHDLSASKMKIRGRGNSTWFLHPKKPFQLKFDDKTEMLGMAKDKKWLFLAEYSDKTMLRNTIAFEMGYISNLDWTPLSTFAEVFINNSYNGTYNISQKVEESDHRLQLGDSGYLLEIDQIERLDEDDVYFYTDAFLINIKEPELEKNSLEYNYVKEYINEFERVLFSSSFKTNNTGYINYIDLDSFIDWYLISEITKNVDSKHFSSIYLNLLPGEKIKMGPLWDFDLAFGNVDYADSQFTAGFWVKNHPWYNRLFQDDSFVSKVKKRFSYFKSNENFILDKIDSHAEHLKWAQKENDEKWKTIGTYVWPNPVVYDSYNEEVDHLKKWYSERMNWLETALNNL